MTLTEISHPNSIGLIASTTDGDNLPIELIKSLAEEYARNENCIILLTVSCESEPLFSSIGAGAFIMTCSHAAAEFENQGAYQLARSFDPDGKRTVGLSATLLFATQFLFLPHLFPI